MTWVRDLPAGRNELDLVLGMYPDFSDAYVTFYLSAIRAVDPALAELCRLRMAMLVGSDLDLALRFEPAQRAGLTEEKISALTSWPRSALFSDRERACLAFAEQFALDHTAIRDDNVERVLEHLTTDEFALFVLVLGRFESLQRLCGFLRLSTPQSPPGRLQDFVLAPQTAPAERS